MKNILPWLIPPVIGAVIGYITNAIAIKMLFRPLREVRFFGIRVPFTPGILPRQRRKLADSIGRMVERELLTPEMLRDRLTSQGVKDSLKAALSGYTEKLFTLPVGEWLPRASNLLIAGAEMVYPHAARAITGFLGRNDVRETVETHLRLMVSKVMLDMNVLQRLVITAGQYDKTIEEKIPRIVIDLVNQLDEFLQSREGRERIIQIIEKEIKDLPEKNPGLCLERLMVSEKNETGEGEPLKSKLDSFLAEKILDAAGRQTENLLGAINVRTLVSERIDSLDMLRVERIILDVLAGQLWWINIFGGILGFLIGLFQSVLSLFL